jgi:integrase
VKPIDLVRSVNRPANHLELTATWLAERGCSEREIMAVTGHKSVSEVSRYTKAADQSRLADQECGNSVSREQKERIICPELDHSGQNQC